MSAEPVASSSDTTTDLEVVQIACQCTKCGMFFRRDVPRAAWDTRTIINCEACQPSLKVH